MTATQDHSILNRCVRAVWLRDQRKNVSLGLLSFLRWIIPLVLLGIAIDWLLDLPSVGRLAVLLLVLVIPIVQAWKAGWKHLHRFRPSRTAIAIEEQEGGLESLLASAIELRENGPTPGTSRSLAEATLQKAESAAAEIEPRRIITFRSLRRPALIALAFGGVMFALATFNQAFFQVGMIRILNPWANLSYPTKTTLTVTTGNLVVREGDRAFINASVSDEIPLTATLLLQTGEREPREIELEVTGGKVEYLLASASRDFRYQIKAGDARSDWHTVDVISAPRFSDVKVDLEYPSYIERENETLEALTLTVPESSKLRWNLTLDQPVSSAVLHRDDGDAIPLEITNNGHQLIIEEQVEASRGYSFSWVEKKHGFPFTSPRYYLQVSSDQLPQVEVTRPEGNLNALLGRKLDIAVRARDDHGLGPAKITYRVNLRPAKTVTLEQALIHNEGEQTLEWDYRTELPDLQIGDTVSFFVEVADRYPGLGGPNVARSETRRLTFLSREDYLAQIKRKQDRLLTRVRSIYRQERDAHELVRNLDSADSGFLQTCQLEAIRQEMLREQLKETARSFQDLLDDLSANQVEEAVEKEALVLMKEGIESIADGEIAGAANLLRNQAGTGNADPMEAVEAVNLAARKLSRLVLLRGIDSAREVFARECRMLAREQAGLRLLTLRSDDSIKVDELVARHESLGLWTRELINSLQKGMRYDRRPIAVLQLSRRIKELSSGGIFEKLKTASELIRNEKAAEAAGLQNEIISAFLKAEFSIRTGSEYASLMAFREKLAEVRKSHDTLRDDCESIPSNEFANRKGELAARLSSALDQLIPALLPPVPAPRPRLFDEILPKPPPVGQLRLTAEATLVKAFQSLQGGDQKTTLTHQKEASETLAKLDRLLESSSVELGLRTSGLTTLVSGASERVNLIEEFEARQIGILERTEEAALDEIPSKPLAEAQELLGGDIVLLTTELAKESKGSPEVLPLLDHLQQLDFFLKEATSNLAKNESEEALGDQEQAADLLAEALEIAQKQVERLTLLQDLYTFQRAVGNASGWMTDIVAEQEDLIEATKKAKPETAPKLVPIVKNLRQCLVDIAPVLDLVAGRLDAGTPLLFAGTDLEDAVFGLEDGDLLDAEDAQTVAAESLAKVQVLVDAVERQTGYTAEIVEYLHRVQAQATLMAFRQQQLRQQVAAAPEELPAMLRETQKELLEKATQYRQSLKLATGMASLAGPADLMEGALAALKSGDRKEAGSKMELATEELSVNAEDLFLIITMLHGLPAIEINSTSEPALVLLTEVLALASDQRRISRQTKATPGEAARELLQPQIKLLETSSKTLTTTPPHPKLIAINGHLARAVSGLANSNLATAQKFQASADQDLRHYVIEQALVLETAEGLPSSSDEPVLSENETDDLYESTANFVSDFVSGEAPKDKRTEWEVLGNRNRAALNQNFARELPLEYRAVLKNYYERVAK